VNGLAGVLYDITKGITCYPLCGQLCEASCGHCELCHFLPNTCLTCECFW